MVRTTHTYVPRQIANWSFSNPCGIGTAYTHSAVSKKLSVHQVLATYVHKIICKSKLKIVTKQSLTSFINMARTGKQNASKKKTPVKDLPKEEEKSKQFAINFFKNEAANVGHPKCI